MKRIVSFISATLVILLMSVTLSHALTAEDEKKIRNGLDQYLWSRASANMELVRGFADRGLAKDEELMFENSIRNIIETLTLLGSGEMKKISAENICINGMTKVDLSVVERDWLSVDDLFKAGADFKNVTIRESIKNILTQFNKVLCQKD